MSPTPRQILTALPYELIVLDVQGNIIEAHNTTRFNVGASLYEQISERSRADLTTALQKVFSQRTPADCQITRAVASADRYRLELHPITEENDVVYAVAEMKRLNTIPATQQRIATDYGQLTYHIERDTVLRADELSCSLLQLPSNSTSQWYNPAVVHPDDLPSVDIYHKRVIQHLELNQSPSHIQFRVTTAEQTYWVDVIASISDAAEKVVNIEVGYIESASPPLIEQGTAFVESVLAALPGYVLVYDFDLARTVYASPSLERLLGVSIFDLPDSSIFSRIHPDDVQGMLDYGYTRLPHLHDGEVASNESRVMGADGEWRWFLSHDVVLARRADGSVKQILGVTLDITERKQAEAELEHIWRRYHNIFENTTDAILISTWGNSYEDSRLLDANQKAELLTGYSKAEMFEMRSNDLLSPDEVPKAKMRRKQVANNVPGSKLVERRGVKKDGSIIHVESLALLVHDENGSPEEMIVFARDITERKQQEQQLHDALQTAQAASQAKSEFLANMSHELRTPLNAVMGYAELLDETATDTRTREWAGHISRSGRHLLFIINDILTAARFDAGMRVPVNPTVFTLNDALRDVVTMFEMPTAQKKLDFCVNIDIDAALIVEADEVKLRQILINLLNNAVKFTMRGEIRFDACLVPDDTLEIVIADTGRGMTDDEQAHLFERFFHPDPTQSGTGLGLAISRDYVELLGGTITCDSAPGRGTTFTLHLPFKPVVATNAMSVPPAQTDWSQPSLETFAAPMPDMNALALLPADWLREFHQVALAADDNRAEALIREIADTHTDLAAAIMTITANFLLVPLAQHIAPLLDDKH